MRTTIAPQGDGPPVFSPGAQGQIGDPVPSGQTQPVADLTVLVHRLDPQMPIPSYAMDGDAGADLCAASDIALAPGERVLVGTGLAIALPAGFAAFVHPRSGLATRHGVSLVNSPGTIDSGYRGEIKLIIINLDPRETLHLTRGERVAQLVVQRVEHAAFHEVDALPESPRGESGHGSTGRM